MRRQVLTCVALFLAHILVEACGARTPLDGNDPFAPAAGSGGASGAASSGAVGTGTTGVGTSAGGASGGAGTGSAGVGVAGAGAGGSPSSATGVGGSPSSAAGVGGAPSSGSGTGIAGAGASSSGGEGGSVGCPISGLNVDLIDDMNDGNPAILRVNGRSGTWFAYHDETSATMFPPLDRVFAMSDTGEYCRLNAVHVYGGPFVNWGAGFGANLGSPYNASRARGVVFTAKSATSTLLRVGLPDENTAPEGGICDSNATTGTRQCYDSYAKRVSLSPNWTKVTIMFTELRQDGWGYSAGRFDPSTLYSIHFDVAAGTKFDVWIDDLAFLP